MNKAIDQEVNIFISIGKVFANLALFIFAIYSRIHNRVCSHAFCELKYLVRSQKYSIQIKMAFLRFTRLTLVNFHTNNLNKSRQNC